MLTKLASIIDYEEYAKITMSKPMFEYLQGYSEDGHTKAANHKDFEYIKLKQRGMANMKYFKGSETTILGNKVSSPIQIAPISF